MDFEFESKWRATVKKASNHFGEELDLQTILFLIGAQELGKGYLKLNKNEKVEVMHIAICTLLEPYGYYNFMGLDEDGWPHFEASDKLPSLSSGQQDRLIKEAVMEYMDN